MSERLKKMQYLRGSLTTKTYRKAIQGVADIMRDNPQWNSEKFSEVCNLIYQYGVERMQYGFWDGAIESHLNLIDDRLDRLEAEEYAEAAAAAGQQELLEPKPDHPHDARCDGFVNTYDPNSNTGSSTSV